jgi:hypothetical protein
MWAFNPTVALCNFLKIERFVQVGLLSRAGGIGHHNNGWKVHFGPELSIQAPFRRTMESWISDCDQRDLHMIQPNQALQNLSLGRRALVFKPDRPFPQQGNQLW